MPGKKPSSGRQPGKKKAPKRKTPPKGFFTRAWEAEEVAGIGGPAKKPAKKEPPKEAPAKKTGKKAAKKKAPAKRKPGKRKAVKKPTAVGSAMKRAAPKKKKATKKKAGKKKKTARKKPSARKPAVKKAAKNEKAGKKTIFFSPRVTSEIGHLKRLAVDSNVKRGKLPEDVRRQIIKLSAEEAEVANVFIEHLNTLNLAAAERKSLIRELRAAGVRAQEKLTERQRAEAAERVRAEAAERVRAEAAERVRAEAAKKKPQVLPKKKSAKILNAGQALAEGKLLPLGTIITDYNDWQRAQLETFIFTRLQAG